MNYLIGIDEAGWGPVLGPLVLAGIVVEELTLPLLKKYGVKDSKLFGNGERARKKRKEVWEKTFPHLLSYSVKIISAHELDNGNTIDLEIKNIARILHELKFASTKKVDISKIIVGLLGKLSRKKFISALFNLGCRIPTRKLIYEKKADRNYLPVSAASILAKITRDQKVEELCSSFGEKYVSGYPNSNTALFLKKYYSRHGGLPPQTRITRKWLPLQELLLQMNRMRANKTNKYSDEVITSNSV